MTRIHSAATSISWIPIEAVEGIQKLSFRAGLGHYDPPPPDVVTDVDSLIAKDAIRFANVLQAWIEVDDGGRVTGHGFGSKSGGRIGSTHVRVAPRGVSLVFPAVPYPVIRPDPRVAGDHVRFVQTAGGRPGMPLPRHVRRRPFVQISGPTVWTTLSLTIHGDGRSDLDMIGASSFPRHWVYDSEGGLASKSGLIDYEKWYYESFGSHSPWGREDSEVVVTAIGSALERELSVEVIGARPRLRKLRPGQVLVSQGDTGNDLFLLLDGILRVERDGEAVTEVGPGAILGEKAVLGDGSRTATLVAVTPCRTAVVPGDTLDREALRKLSAERP